MFRKIGEETQSSIPSMHCINAAAPSVEHYRINYTACLNYSSTYMFQMQVVADYCSSFIRHHISTTNCLNVREFGVRHGQMGLVRIAESYIRRNFSQVYQTKEFHQLPFQHLLLLLKSSHLVVDCKTCLFYYNFIVTISNTI